MIRGDGRDIMSVLLRANSAEDPKSKMSEEEIVDQISCVLLLTLSHSMTAPLDSRAPPIF